MVVNIEMIGILKSIFARRMRSEIRAEERRNMEALLREEMELEIAAHKPVKLSERQAEAAKRNREMSAYRESAQLLDENRRREVEEVPQPLNPHILNLEVGDLETWTLEPQQSVNLLRRRREIIFPALFLFVPCVIIFPALFLFVPFVRSSDTHTHTNTHTYIAL